MSHTPTILDVKTDILRSINSTYSVNGLKDKNYKYFLNRAIKIFEKMNIDEKKKDLFYKQIRKSENTRKGIDKVREDILLIASIL